MWLAWAYGACLVPAPRSLVRSGMDLGPWLVANDVNVVSTVPTLVSLWPTEALDKVRLLILGGEACPPEIGERLATEDREVWNTYGPTEATVVSCGARLTGEGPVRIGLPLDGWDLAVVDAAGTPVAEGGTGELIIGGVGLARYLDPDQDRERFAPLPTPRLGPRVPQRRPGPERRARAWSSSAGPTTRSSSAAAGSSSARSTARCSPCRGSPVAAAAVRTTRSGNQVLVGYVATEPDVRRPRLAWHTCAPRMPAPLVPRLAVVDDPADPHLGQGRPRRPAVAGDQRRDRSGVRRRSWRAPRPGCTSSGPTSSGPRSTTRTTTSSTSAGAA